MATEIHEALVLKPQRVKAVQFDGTNSAEVASFLRYMGIKARARGFYVECNHLESAMVPMHKGDWAVLGMYLSIFDNEQFQKEFVLVQKESHAL